MKEMNVKNHWQMNVMRGLDAVGAPLDVRCSSMFSNLQGWMQSPIDETTGVSSMIGLLEGRQPERWLTSLMNQQAHWQASGLNPGRSRFRGISHIGPTPVELSRKSTQAQGGSMQRFNEFTWGCIAHAVSGGLRTAGSVV